MRDTQPYELINMLVSMTPSSSLAALDMSIKSLESCWKKNPSFSLESDFPFNDLHALKEVGALNAAPPIENTGLGLGHSPEGGCVLQNLLRTAGYRNLSLGRCLEGHINVLHLVYVYGPAQKKSMFATQVNKGLLAGI